MEKKNLRRNLNDHLFNVGIMVFVAIASLVAWRMSTNSGSPDIIPVEYVAGPADTQGAQNPKLTSSPQVNPDVDATQLSDTTGFASDEELVDTVSPIVVESVRLRRDGKLTDAIRVLRAGLTREPNNADIMAELGAVLISAIKIGRAHV